jgi:hypothetical protein
MATLGFATACECRADPTSASLSQNVGASFATCNEKEIRFLAAKHNLQLAFRPCGNNTFSAYRWSPDGLRLYFQLVLSSYIMDADAANRATTTMPVSSPTGEATWLTPVRVAIPVVGDDPEDPPRIALLDFPQRTEIDDDPPAVTMAHHVLEGLVAPDDLHVGDNTSEILFTAAKVAEGPRAVYVLDIDQGTFEPAFPGLTEPVTSFTYARSKKLSFIGTGDTVRALDRAGTETARWDHAERGTLSPDGTWVALEFEGAPTSLYYQRAWDEVSDGKRKREMDRAKQFEDGLPEWFPKDVRPPTLSFVKLGSEDRWTVTSFLGDHFQWYDAADGWGSFFLWGFEGKQFKRNVALVNLNDRLNAMAEGRTMLGVQPFEPPPPPTPVPEAP